MTVDARSFSLPQKEIAKQVLPELRAGVWFSKTPERPRRAKAITSWARMVLSAIAYNRLPVLKNSLPLKKAAIGKIENVWEK
jgi:hypothetical protein